MRFLYQLRNEEKSLESMESGVFAFIYFRERYHLRSQNICPEGRKKEWVLL